MGEALEKIGMCEIIDGTFLLDDETASRRLGVVGRE